MFSALGAASVAAVTGSPYTNNFSALGAASVAAVTGSPYANNNDRRSYDTGNDRRSDETVIDRQARKAVMKFASLAEEDPIEAVTFVAVPAVVGGAVGGAAGGVPGAVGGATVGAVAGGAAFVVKKSTENCVNDAALEVAKNQMSFTGMTKMLN